MAQAEREAPVSSSQFARFLQTKLGTAFPIDGVGDLKPPVLPQVLITTDNVPDAPDTAGSSNPVLTVTPPGTTTPIVSTIDTLGDQDFYRVTLSAGVTYEFGLYSYNGGPNAAGLTDPYLELYASDGTSLLVSADGGADTAYNQINSGFDVLLVYTPTTSGTFYVNARAFSNSPATETGDSVGDYQLFVREQDLTDPDIYRPYYEPTEPLYAIDWGTQVNKVNQSARNPDGEEGTRDTGNVQGTPEYSTEFDVPALATAQGEDITGKNVITIYFARPGDVFVSNDPTNPGLPPATITAVAIQDFEYTAVWTALEQFEQVADVVYLEVDDRDQADFVYTSYLGTPGPGVSLLGSMSPPDESDEGLAQFNSGDERWNERDLAQGGFSFVTLIHEFGHGHGLAHPHDNGGHSGIMNGVEGEGLGVADYTTGDFALNQGVFTMMSYEDGWQSSPYGNAETDVGYGYLGGLMAFDIAAIQDKYGVNEDWATGDDTYTLKDVNAAGTFFFSIWDGGGTDAIVYAGTRDTTIDLRPATLQYETGGGGWVSFADGIFGGFTIANGVTVENATSGGGNDLLIGNAAANVLTGHGGNDTYYVQNSGDRAIEGAGGGTDRVSTNVSFTLDFSDEIELLEVTTLSGTDAIDLGGSNTANTLYGNAGINFLHGNGGDDAMWGFGGDDYLVGGTGADAMWGGGGDDTYYIDQAGDLIYEVAGEGYDRVAPSIDYTLPDNAEVELIEAVNLTATVAMNLGGSDFANTIHGNNGNNVLHGYGGNDVLWGFGGDDYLVGGSGNDVMTGGLGNDTYYVDAAGDLVYELPGEGSDRVATTISYTLHADADIELLETVGASGTDALTLTGSNRANTIVGNAGANAIDGKGGGDTLWGLAGADTFAFTTALGAGNVDILADFQTGTDKIALEADVFTRFNPGSLDAATFRVGGAAADEDDFVIYDSATGALYYDADGNGAGAAVQFAVLASGLALAASDFAVI
jgi:serralysin